MKSSIAARRRLVFILTALCILLLAGESSIAAQTPPTSGPGSAFSVPRSNLIQPEALAQLLRSHSSQKPLIFQVGSHVLYTEAHIPGSEYEGPGSQSAGLQSLSDRVASVAHKQFIVLYCGCCPWNHCPNIGPAFQQMRALGFTNVKVLYLPSNFGTDWVSKGYPVE